MNPAITIPFNRPHFPDSSFSHIKNAIINGKLSGNGPFTKMCHQFFQENYGFKKVLLTSSCTDALEMSALLAQIAPGDEVIIPSFTFPSTANAFVLRGAKIVFADSSSDNPNLDTQNIEPLITKRTKAIVPVHYSGIACDMDPISQLADNHGLFVIEDAAQAVDSFYKGQPLGSIGHFGTFSFHETKNLSSGEGGMLAINHAEHMIRSEILWEKGTNRASFFRGEVDKYGWVDVGSSFLPSDIIAALLYAQLEQLEVIQKKRLQIWNQYHEGLKPLSDAGYIKLPHIPSFATNNAHLFYVICKGNGEMQELIDFLAEHGIAAVFHYQPLHQSKFYCKKHDGRNLPYSEYYSKCLLRLPLYYDLSLENVGYVIFRIINFYERIYSSSPEKNRDELAFTPNEG
jgi:dTDP-4-amino-4,6-dideoxygalactose transaminase